MNMKLLIISSDGIHRGTQYGSTLYSALDMKEDINRHSVTYKSLVFLSFFWKRQSCSGKINNK